MFPCVTAVIVLIFYLHWKRVHWISISLYTHWRLWSHIILDGYDDGDEIIG